MALNLEQTVHEARNGNRQALETIIAQVQDKIYGLAMRMLGQAEDAEDETQEILIKVITHLSEFREESAFTSWVYRIACNHLLTTRKRNNERTGITFELLEDLISDEARKPYPSTFSQPEREILRVEARVGCLQGLLICLESEYRMAYILGDVFEVTSDEGAYVLGITPESFRKRLSRARERLQRFMIKNCGLVNQKNPCSCDKKACLDLDWGGFDPNYPARKKGAVQTRKEALAQFKELSEIERVTELFRRYPEYQSPESFTYIVKDLIDSGKYKIFA
jgi:RNA polymerase sigma factor (sigma-70 family)